MKKIVLFLLLEIVLQTNICSQQGWQFIYSFEQDVQDICFIDSATGYAGTSSMAAIKKIIKTTDGGYTWNDVIQTEAGVNNIYFYNNDIGFACCENGKIFKTVDGGLNWGLIQLSDPNYVYNIFFLNENLGWACVGTNKIYKTTDGGLNWTYSITANVIANRDIGFVNENIGYAIGLYGVMLKSTDGGSNWFEVIPPYSSSMFDIEFVDEVNGFLVGGDWIAKTTDGGINWDIIQSAGGNQLNSITTYNKKYVWVAGTAKIYYTSDGGISWSLQSFTPYSYLNQISSVDSAKAWLLGDKKLYRTNSGGVLDINDSENGVPNNFILSQNYPNPFNPFTIISWQTPVSGWQTLKVYDILGREVGTLIDEFKNAGSFKVQFNPNNLPSGVYFYQLKAGNFVQTKKMILIK